MEARQEVVSLLSEHKIYQIYLSHRHLQLTLNPTLNIQTIKRILSNQYQTWAECSLGMRHHFYAPSSLKRARVKIAIFYLQEITELPNLNWLYLSCSSFYQESTALNGIAFKCSVCEITHLEGCGKDHLNVREYACGLRWLVALDESYPLV